MTQQERPPRLAWLGRPLPVVLSTVSVVLLARAAEGDVSPPCAAGSTEEKESEFLAGTALVLSIAATVFGVGYLLERVRLRPWLVLFTASLASGFASGLAAFGCLQ